MVSRKLIAFDFDGVIADSMPGQERAWRQAASAAGCSLHLEERLVGNFYDGNAGSRMFEGLDLTPETAGRLRSAKDAIWLAMRDSTPLMRGSETALPRIAEQYVVAVATTADSKYVTGLLAREKLLTFVSAIVTDRDVPNPKPAPDMLFRLIGDLSCDAKDTCLVGDSRTDYEMSRAAGVGFIRFASHQGASGLRAPTVSSWDALAAHLLFGHSEPREL